jgi:hypothetical protein
MIYTTGKAILVFVFSPVIITSYGLAAVSYFIYFHIKDFMKAKVPPVEAIPSPYVVSVSVVEEDN